MNRNGFTSRRALLLGGTGLIAAGATGLLAKGGGARGLRPTPRQVEGPYYTGEIIRGTDADLVENGPVAAGGIPVLVGGRVLDADGQPIANASVEIWQCDAGGTYHHPRDGGTRDANFQGFGRALCGADGGYAFRAIRPVPYGQRTPHIHFKVEAAGFRTLTTQLYVAEERERNARDPVFRDLSRAEAEAVTASFSPGADGRLRALFDIILARA